MTSASELVGCSACCVAIEAEPLAAEAAEELARRFKALGDRHRLAIVHLLAVAGEPVCVVDIERHVPVAQSTISYHLRLLVDAGILTMERKGRWSYYQPNPGVLESLSMALDGYARRGSSTMPASA